MGCIDQTSIFRQRVTELSRAYPPADPKRSKAKAHRNTKPSEDATDDGFLTEAYAIVSGAWLLDFSQHSKPKLCVLARSYNYSERPAVRDTKGVFERRRPNSQIPEPRRFKRDRLCFWRLPVGFKKPYQ